MEKKMTKAEMRVAVAKDVIKQIEAKKYQAVCGQYISIGDAVSDFFRGLLGLNPKAQKEQLQKYMPELTGQTCEVCAKGAAFLTLC